VFLAWDRKSRFVLSASGFYPQDGIAIEVDASDEPASARREFLDELGLTPEALLALSERGVWFARWDPPNNAGDRPRHRDVAPVRRLRLVRLSASASGARIAVVRLSSSSRCALQGIATFRLRVEEAIELCDRVARERMLSAGFVLTVVAIGVELLQAGQERGHNRTSHVVVLQERCSLAAGDRVHPQPSSVGAPLEGGQHCVGLFVPVHFAVGLESKDAEKSPRELTHRVERHV
jgi:hypothetical protein